MTTASRNGMFPGRQRNRPMRHALRFCRAASAWNRRAGPRSRVQSPARAHSRPPSSRRFAGPARRARASVCDSREVTRRVPPGPGRRATHQHRDRRRPSAGRQDADRPAGRRPAGWPVVPPAGRPGLSAERGRGERPPAPMNARSRKNIHDSTEPMDRKGGRGAGEGRGGSGRIRRGPRQDSGPAIPARRGALVSTAGW